MWETFLCSLFNMSMKFGRDHKGRQKQHQRNDDFEKNHRPTW
jgi:hypothetical protein